MNFNTRVGYRIYDNFGKGQCERFQINGPMRQFCIPQDSVYRGNVTVGETLAVNIFEWIHGEEEGHAQVTETCVPVKLMGYYARDQNVDEEEFFNWIPMVDPNLFNPPTYC